MAEVFAAKLYGSDGFEKDLVIKQILPQHARDPEFVQSFVAEAKIAVSLNHANIVAIYELGRVDGTYFIAMEFVDGMDLYAFVDACRRHNVSIEPGHALYAVEEVAKGLDYAHRGIGPDGQPLGLVHRDLNPRNVLASKQGEIKILDFGIAKVRSTIAAMPKTRAGVVKGTTGYMSPEQAMGLEVDARTDIYQAGLLLYELLTGRALFWRPDDESTRALMRRHEVRPVSAVVPGIPKEVDALLFATLTRNPDERIADAATLARYLAQLRYQLYPSATATGLGLQVAQLAALEAQAEATVEPEIPATEELSEVISRAIQQSIGHPEVETIARSDIAPRGRPTTGSEPISLALDRPTVPRADESSPELIPTTIAPPPAPPSDHSFARVLLTADGQLVPHLDPNHVQNGDPNQEQDRDATEVLPGPPPESLVSRLRVAVGAIDRPTTWVVLAVAASALVFLSAWLLIAVPSESAPVSPPAPAPEPPPKAAAPAISADPPQETGTDDSADPDRRASTPDARPPQASRPTGFATVAFGTRSCSSRVSLDGKIIAYSTPSFDHRVPAGPHIVVLEGVGCPPIERPGSLQQAIPSVRRQIEVEPGTSLRVIADFERNTITVRKR